MQNHTSTHFLESFLFFFEQELQNFANLLSHRIILWSEKDVGPLLCDNEESPFISLRCYLLQTKINEGEESNFKELQELDNGRQRPLIPLNDENIHWNIFQSEYRFRLVEQNQFH